MYQFLPYLSILLLWGFLCNSLLSILIIKKGYLTFPSGVVIGGLVGIVIFIITPLLWIALLVFFFSSSLLSRWKFDQKKDISIEFSKGDRRDALQVLSNSVPSIFFGIIYLFTNISSLTNENGEIQLFLVSPWLYAAFGSLATHTADTWMTEIGITSTEQPRLITNIRKKVPKGTSGGLSLIGTTAGLLGSLIISIIFTGALIFLSSSTIIHIILTIFLIMLAGFLGALLDSLEGAIIQGIYYCEFCNKETEKKIHRCGQKTKFMKGFSSINNDFVNLSSAFIGGWIAFIGLRIIELVI